MNMNSNIHLDIRHYIVLHSCTGYSNILLIQTNIKDKIKLKHKPTTTIIIIIITIITIIATTTIIIIIIIIKIIVILRRGRRRVK